MAALLGAIKGGQDRPQDRDNVPFRNGNNSNNSSSIAVSPAGASSGAAAAVNSVNSIPIPKTPTSSDGPGKLSCGL